MKNNVAKVVTVMIAVLFMSITVLERNVEARAGGSRSSGSGGSRSYSRPASPSPQSGPSRQQMAPAPGAFQQQPAGGGFLRSMAGGMAGGMLGSMLFSSFAGAGGGMGGGMGGSGGIGLFEIILLAGGGYLIYRYIRKKKAESDSDPYRR